MTSIEVSGPPVDRSAEVLTPEALEFVADLQRQFGVEPLELEPRVYFRITDNWLELTVRFLVGTHRIRGAKDAMSRYLVEELDRAGIRAHSVVVPGHAADVLVRHSAYADLLVVGSPKHHPFPRRILASTAELCALRSQCPTMLVRPV